MDVVAVAVNPAMVVVRVQTPVTVVPEPDVKAMPAVSDTLALSSGSVHEAWPSVPDPVYVPRTGGVVCA
jgi:hypothetical protein